MIALMDSSCQTAVPGKHLLDLPSEIILDVFKCLDPHDITVCMRVCRFFYKLSENAPIRLKFELAASGLEEGHSAALSTVERMQLVRRYQDAWQTPNLTHVQTVDMSEGGAWELYGGVLAQSQGERSIRFRRLPAILRGIEERVWEINDVGAKIRDFTMDPAQDLLVILEQSPRHVKEPSVNALVRSISTGKPHPRAANAKELSIPLRRFTHYQYLIQICGDCLGLFIDTEHFPKKLVICDWTTGEIYMSMLGSTLTSFAFLTDTHVLIADLDLTEEGSGPSLVALNFSKPKSGAVHLESTEDASFFQFPPVSCPDITDMHIRSDPAPGWRPSSDLQVPFYASRDRLFVVTLRVRHPIRDHVFFVPTSTFLPHLTEGSCRHVPWDTWVPHGSRLLRHLSLSSTWVCYVYGQRVIARSDAGPIRDSLLLLDFDQKRCRHARFRGEFLGINTKATTITPAQNTIFNATIKTDLPFRCAVIKLPHPSSLDAAEVAMCSEDGIVIVNVGLCDESRDRKFDLIAVASSQVSYIVALNIRS